MFSFILNNYFNFKWFGTQRIVTMTIMKFFCMLNQLWGRSLCLLQFCTPFFIIRREKYCFFSQIQESRGKEKLAPTTKKKLLLSVVLYIDKGIFARQLCREWNETGPFQWTKVYNMDAEFHDFFQCLVTAFSFGIPKKS